MDRETILRRASRLAAMTQSGGATQAEAETAAARLGELLRENNLSMQDVTTAELEAEMQQAEAATGFRRIPGWAHDLSQYVASATETKVYVYSSCIVRGDNGCPQYKRARFKFVGHEADAAVAGYFMEYLLRALPDMAKRRRPYNRAAYLSGVAIAVAIRLRNAIHPVGDVDSGKDTALTVAKKQAVEEYCKKAFADSISKKMPTASDGDPYSRQEGYQDGQRVPLNLGIATAQTDAKRITG